MLRVSSETVKTFAVCWKKSAVSCIRAINLTTEIVESAEFILFCATIVGRLYRTPSSFLTTWLPPGTIRAAYEDPHFSKRSPAREARALPAAQHTCIIVQTIPLARPWAV